MNNIVLEKIWTQNSPIVVDNLIGTTVTGESEAHTFRVRGVDAAQEPVAITGTITGKLLNANNDTVALTGSLSNGIASVTLTETCYAVPGRFIVSIFATNTDVTQCLYCGVGNVFRASSSSIAYPTDTLPDITSLMADLEDILDGWPADYSAIQSAVTTIQSQIGNTPMGTTATTITGAIAEHEGDIGDLKSQIGTLNYEYDLTLSAVQNYYINTNASVGNTINVTPISNSSLVYLRMPCYKGETFSMVGKGDSGARSWCFTDSSNVVLAVSDANAPNPTAVAPADGYVVLNSYKSQFSSITLFSYNAKRVGGALKEVFDDNLYHEYDLTNSVTQDAWIKTNAAIGETIDPTLISNSSLVCLRMACYKGEIFEILGNGDSQARSWCFTDDNNVVINVSAPSGAANATVTAPEDGYIIINSYKSQFTSIKLISLNVARSDARFINADDEIHTFLEDNFKRTYDLASLFVIDSYIAGTNVENADIGDTVNITGTENAYLEYLRTKCYKGEVFILTGQTDNHVRLWSFTDDDNVLLTASDANVSSATVTAPADGYIIVNSYKGAEPTAILKSSNIERVVDDTISKTIDEIKNGAPYRYIHPDFTGTYEPIYIKPIDGSTGSDFDVNSVTAADVNDAYSALATAYPNYITKTELGYDQSGTKKIWHFSFHPERPVGADGNMKELPTIIFTSGVHGPGLATSGDSALTVLSLYYFFKDICTNWRQDGLLEYLRWNVNFEIIPVVNPWGFDNGSRLNSRGVDIMRNFSAGWRASTPGTNIYGGTAPWSEAESIHVRTVIDAHSDAVLYADWHTNGLEAVAQNVMVYTAVLKDSEVLYPIYSTIEKCSHLWQSKDYEGLNDIDFNGYMYMDLLSGMDYQYPEKVYNMPACIIEGFTGVSGMSYDLYNVEYVKMVMEEIGIFLASVIKQFSTI